MGLRDGKSDGGEEAPSENKVLDGVQTALDVVGLIPGVGEIADGLNAAIDTARGDYVDAALSTASMVPFAGAFATGGKLVGKAAKGEVHYADDLVRAAQKLYPNKAGLTELHPIAPKNLGGAKNGALVPLDGAYRQVITNEFRSLYPHGLPKPGEARMLDLMKQVYSKYPLPPGF